MAKIDQAEAFARRLLGKVGKSGRAEVPAMDSSVITSASGLPPVFAGREHAGNRRRLKCEKGEKIL